MNTKRKLLILIPILASGIICNVYLPDGKPMADGYTISIMTEEII